jgi:hypothetical protein
MQKDTEILVKKIARLLSNLNLDPLLNVRIDNSEVDVYFEYAGTYVGIDCKHLYIGTIELKKLVDEWDSRIKQNMYIGKKEYRLSKVIVAAYAENLNANDITMLKQNRVSVMLAGSIDDALHKSNMLLNGKYRNFFEMLILQTYLNIYVNGYAELDDEIEKIYGDDIKEIGDSNNIEDIFLRFRIIALLRLDKTKELVRVWNNAIQKKGR